MKNISFRLLIFAAVAIATLTITPDLMACPTCKAGMSDGDHHGLQEGFYWSILFMMSMPFFIIGGLSTMFYLSIRKAQREQTMLPQKTTPHLVLPASE